MRSKALLAMAVAGVFSWSGAYAIPEGGVPSAADEITPSMSTLTSLDRTTGGYKGWGPMANPQTPSAADETTPSLFTQQLHDRAHQQMLAEVEQAREQVWVANAPLRAEYDNIGATRDRGGGFGRFFQRDR